MTHKAQYQRMHSILSHYSDWTDSQKAFCEYYDISPSSFHYWRKKLKIGPLRSKNISLETSPKGFSSIQLDTLSANACPPSEEVELSSVQVDLPNGLTLHLSNLCSTSLIALLLKLWESDIYA